MALIRHTEELMQLVYGVNIKFYGSDGVVAATMQEGMLNSAIIDRNASRGLRTTADRLLLVNNDIVEGFDTDTHFFVSGVETFPQEIDFSMDNMPSIILPEGDVPF
jgi:hypothetical protein